MISQTIQLALAPVFVLVALGNILNLLASRLARVVDRSRDLQKRHANTMGDEHDAVVREIRIFDRRIVLITRAIVLLVMAGFCIGVTVLAIFVEEMFRIDMGAFAAGVFIMSIGLLMWALLLVLRETQLSIVALRIPRDYLELDRKL